MSNDVIRILIALGVGLLFLGIYLYVFNRWLQTRRAKKSSQVNFDHLDGAEFEKFVADLMTRRGYRVEHTGRAGDLGVDLIAEKPPYRFAVQVKRQAHPVSRHAVSDAVAGKAKYNCNAAMVVTNNIFTHGARDLAKANGCKLVDRNILAEWLGASEL